MFDISIKVDEKEVATVAEVITTAIGIYIYIYIFYYFILFYFILFYFISILFYFILFCFVLFFKKISVRASTIYYKSGVDTDKKQQLHKCDYPKSPEKLKQRNAIF